MGIKSRDWETIGKCVSQIKEEGLSYAEGSKRYGISEQDINEYQRRKKSVKERGISGKVKDRSQIGEYVRKIREHGLSYIEGAEQFGINVAEIYRYNSRIKEKRRVGGVEIEGKSEGVENAEPGGMKLKGQAKVRASEENGGEELRDEVIESDASSARRYIQLPDGVSELIIDYRRQNPDHGYKRIEEYIKSRYFVVVPRKKIREVLKLHGLTGKSDSSFDKPVEERIKGIRRFEASYPRELYQMDITYVYLSNNAICYLVIIVDDYSRFCVAGELRQDQRGISMIEVLHRAIERYGKPAKLLTDQGSSFYSWGNEQTLFARYLDDMKIEHIVADPHSPQTLGKVERLNQTVQRELLNKSHFVGYEETRRSIDSYFHQYNYERPHQGIGGSNPASRFHGIIGETSRIESEISGNGLDFSRGYLVFKMYEHTISIVCNACGLQVFLDGNLLESSKSRVEGNRNSK